MVPNSKRERKKKFFFHVKITEKQIINKMYSVGSSWSIKLGKCSDKFWTNKFAQYLFGGRKKCFFSVFLTNFYAFIMWLRVDILLVFAGI